MGVSPSDLYVSNGFVREKETNAYIVAMATNYSKDYYNVKLNNNQQYLVKNVDTKADIHTDVNNCYTTADNSVVEVSTYGDTKYSYLGNSLVKDVYVTEITDNK